MLALYLVLVLLALLTVASTWTAISIHGWLGHRLEHRYGPTDHRIADRRNPAGYFWLLSVVLVGVSLFVVIAEIGSKHTGDDGYVAFAIWFCFLVVWYAVGLLIEKAVPHHSKSEWQPPL